MNTHAHEGTAYDYPIELVAITCGGCGIPFGVPRAFYRQCRDEGRWFRCPNVDCGWPRQHYTETTTQKLEQKFEEEERRRKYAERRAEMERDMRRAAELSQRATKGHLTRVRKRVAAGVCPCCKRSFSDLARHMQNKHPGYGESE